MATFNISSGDVTALVAAIIASNSNTEDDVINLAAGVYNLSDYDDDVVRSNDTNFLTTGMPIGSNDVNGLPVVKTKITIVGGTVDPSETVITRTGSQLYRLIYVASGGGNLTLQKLTLRDGNVGATVDHGGGAVYNKGILSILNCKIGPNNRGNYGGAMRNDGTATINGCEIFQNTGDNGAGIYNEGGNITVLNSVIRNNAGRDGGGIHNAKKSTTVNMTIEHCIIRNNTAIYGAGVSSYAGYALVRFCKIHGNRSQGGALYARGIGPNSARITANYNCIYDNHVAPDYSVLNDATAFVLDAQFNWWGRPEGPQAGDIGDPGTSSGSSNASQHLCYAGWGGRTTETATTRYVREKAAEYAIALSRANFEDSMKFPSGASDLSASAQKSIGGRLLYNFLAHSGDSTGSALFMSETIYAGGMPMTLGDGGASECSQNAGSKATGWRRCCGHGNGATLSWRNHEDVRSYFVDNGATPLSNPPDASDTILHADLLTYMKFDQGSDGGGQWRAGHEIDGPQYLYNLFVTGGLLGHIDTGDYIYLNQGPTSQDGYGSHGFLIVGWGVAHSSPDALHAQVGTHFSIERQHNGQEVPYIADFCYGYNDDAGYTGWLQDPRPRPFYTTAADISDAQLTSRFDFDATELNTYKNRLQGGWRRFLYRSSIDCPDPMVCFPAWRFFHIPDGITVALNRIYCPPNPCS